MEFKAYGVFKNKLPKAAILDENIEAYLKSDPNQCFIKAKEASVTITKLIMKYERIEEAPACEESRQYFRLQRLKKEGILEEDILDRFLYIRKLGNSAIFDGIDSKDEAVKVLNYLNEVCLWFLEKYNNIL